MWVYAYLQPFMVCVALLTTSSVVDQLIDGYDGDVKKWAIDIAKVSMTIVMIKNELYNIC